MRIFKMAAGLSWFVITFLLMTYFPACVHMMSANRQSSTKPNIVFVLADDLGYNDIGYHSDQIKTPYLDELAKSGVTLENYYVQPICTPTRSQLMSGRYQIHTGLQHWILYGCQPNALPDDIPTMADKMKEAGYSTHMVGKWHIGFYMEKFCPWKRGFDTFYGYLGGREDYYTHIRSGFLDLWTEKGPVRNETGHYSADLFSNQAINAIRSTAGSSKPLFLYLAYQNVHGPTEVPKKYEDMHLDIKNEKRRKYAGMVSALEEGVKNVTDALKQYGMWDNTILVFSTDNGGRPSDGGNNFPLRGTKKTLWEGGVHGVGFVAGGRVKSSGVVNKELIHVSDWFPTLVGQAGGSFNDTKGLDGFDQWQAIDGGQPSKRDTILHNIDMLWKPRGNSTSKYWDTSVHAALRHGDWKILTGDPGKGDWIKPPAAHDQEYADSVESNTLDEDEPNVQLYNIKEDPTEKNEISKDHPDIVDKLLQMIKQFNDTAVPVRFPDDDPQCKASCKANNVWGPWR